MNDITLQRLKESVKVTPDARSRMKAMIQARIGAPTLKELAQSVRPTPSLLRRMKKSVMSSLKPALAGDIQSLSSAILPSLPVLERMKHVILRELRPVEEKPMYGSAIKWTAAFAAFVLIVRSLPLILLAPSTSAESAVQLVPTGSVSVYVGGVWTSTEKPILLSGPTMIRTDASAQATVILDDDGVLRLGGDTTLKLHDTASRSAPTASLIRGSLWILGLTAAYVDGITVETVGGTVSVNAGSAQVHAYTERSDVSVFDRGALVSTGTKTEFLVAGERTTLLGAGGAVSVRAFPLSSFTNPIVSSNLSQDAVHRSDIAKLQEERREQMAGILPTSIFYPAKRIAEKVDVLFTLSADGRTEKRFQQANTRLSEALALMREGDSENADRQLSEFQSSIVALTASDDDNLVKHLVRDQLASATVALSQQGTGSIALLQSAVSSIAASVPNADLSSREIEGYVLVDRLAAIHQMLLSRDNASDAALAYTDVRPYLADLLQSGSGTHAFLKKEAQSLLVATSNLAKKSQETSADPLLVSLTEDIGKYLPPEVDDLAVSEEELQTRVSRIVDRIFTFRHPRSRYNQLVFEMHQLRGDRNRGTLLRRLKAALPEGLGGYVNTEIQLLGDELQS